MPVDLSSSAELQFLLDNDDWHKCDLSFLSETAKENMVRIVHAEAWMHEHCDSDKAFRFSGSFYFKNEEDYIQFKLMWSE